MERLSDFMDTPLMRAFVAALLLVSCSAAASAETLSLKEAQRRAGGESPTALAGEAAADAAKAGVDEANAQFFPQLHVSETYLRTDDPVAVFGGKLQQEKFGAADFALPSLNNPSPINHWITRFEVNQPIFRSGSDWAKRRAAVEQFHARTHLTAFEKTGAKLAATRLYYAAVALSRQAAALNDGIGRLRKLESSYELAEAQTSASTTSYLVARSVRLSLEAMLTRTDGERKKALRDLNAVMGQDPETPLALSDPLPAVRAPESRKDPGARGAREDIQASASGKEAARANKDAALRRWGPEIRAFGAYNLFTGDFQDAGTSYEAGFRLDWSVFNWGRQGDIRKAKADARRAEVLHRGAELQAAADLENAREDLSSAVAAYRMLASASKTADEGLTIAAQRYQEGTLPLMDYSQAVRNWVEMRLHLVEGHLAAAQASADYDFQKGDL